MNVDDRSGHDSSPADGPKERSLVWGWIGSIGVVALTVLVLVGALVRTPGVPDCYGQSMAGWILLCPWIRAFITNAVLGLGVLVVAVIVGGLLVGGVRLAIRR